MIFTSTLVSIHLSSSGHACLIVSWNLVVHLRIVINIRPCFYLNYANILVSLINFCSREFVKHVYLIFLPAKLATSLDVSLHFPASSKMVLLHVCFSLFPQVPCRFQFSAGLPFLHSAGIFSC